MHFISIIKKIGEKNGSYFKGGYSLVEMIIYVVILSLMTVTVINTLLLLVSSFESIKTSKNITISASTIMERIVREIRNSETIDMGASVFGSNPGILKLNANDPNDVSYTIEFYIENNVLKVKKNNGMGQALSLSNTTVSNLIFRRITTPQGEAVRIELTLQTSEGNFTKTENFYNTVILRGSYGE